MSEVDAHDVAAAALCAGGWHWGRPGKPGYGYLVKHLNPDGTAGVSITTSGWFAWATSIGSGTGADKVADGALVVWARGGAPFVGTGSSGVAYVNEIATMKAEALKRIPAIEAAPLTVAGLVHTAHEAAKAKGWHDGADPTSPTQVLAWLALLHSEVSEGVEDVRRGMMVEDVRSDGKPVGLPSELADVLIRLADTCGALGIDLEGAVRRKLAFNATRSHRHGGKVA